MIKLSKSDIMELISLIINKQLEITSESYDEYLSNREYDIVLEALKDKLMVEYNDEY